MLNIKIICIGKLKEKFYIEASREYLKRLGAYCKIEIDELAEVKRPNNPTQSDIDVSLAKEAEMIKSKIPRSSAVIAMCIEGQQPDSVSLASIINNYACSGTSKLCFIIGGSDGMDSSIKKMANMKLSMSKMTFPHHLARVMLLEQIYRSFKINEGGKYHK